MWARVIIHFCSSLLLLAAIGCGTPGAPQPPSLNLARPVSDLQATRNGDRIALSWTVPTQTTDNANFKHRGQTRVCEGLNRPTLDSCNAITTLATPANSKTGNATTSVPSQAAGGADYATFAVEVQNDRGRSAGLSNQVQVPTSVASALNGTPTAQLTPDAVIVTATVDGRGPGLEQRIELRRAERGTPQPEAVVAQRPLSLSEGSQKLELRDDTFAWEKTFDYRVAIVGTAKMPDGAAVNFDASTSPAIEVVAHDVFPPAVPSGLQAVFSGGTGQQASIDLTWNPDLDRDLAGYFVYRRLQSEPDSAAQRLNAQPVPAPSYRDAAIQPGNTYVYSVSAIDERGNESKRSEQTSEQVPK